MGLEFHSLRGFPDLREQKAAKIVGLSHLTPACGCRMAEAKGLVVRHRNKAGGLQA